MKTHKNAREKNGKKENWGKNTMDENEGTHERRNCKSRKNVKRIY